MTGRWLQVLLPFGRHRARLRQTRPENCTQTVIAMALDLPLEIVEREAGTTGAMSVADTTSLLAKFGIFCRPVSAAHAAEWWTSYRRRSGGRDLRGIGMLLSRDPGRPGHAYLLAGDAVYDPETGITKPLTEAIVRQLDALLLFSGESLSTPQFAAARHALLHR